MLDRNLVKSLIDQALEQNSELFLIDWKIDDSSNIEVIVDSDGVLDLEQIIKISRFIEHNPAMDREKEDFSLSVLSYGAESPLFLPRQFKKHLFKTLSVETTSGLKIEAELIEADDNFITLRWKQREPKKIGKGKQDVENTQKINLNEIKKAKLVLKF